MSMMLIIKCDQLSLSVEHWVCSEPEKPKSWQHFFFFFKCRRLMFPSGTLTKHRVYMEVMCISSAQSRISVYPEKFPVRGKCVHYWSWKPTPFLENSISILGLTHFLPPEDAAGWGVSQLYCVIVYAELWMTGLPFNGVILFQVHCWDQLDIPESI